MKNYELSANEVILFKGVAAVVSDWKNEQNVTEYKTELILTNLNIVLITEIKKLFSRILDKKIYSVKDVKVYDESVQVVRRKNLVDVYLLDGELFLKFEKEKSAKEFCDKAIKLKDGNSKFVRAVKKTQKAIRETNEALDIDIAEMAKGAISTVGDAVIAIDTLTTAGPKTKALAKVAKLFKGKSEKKALAERASEEDNKETCESK